MTFLKQARFQTARARSSRVDQIAVCGVTHTTGHHARVFGADPKARSKCYMFGSAREAAHRRRQTTDLFRNRSKFREVTRTAHACACTPARPPSARLPARSLSPAFHFAFRVVWCCGRSHGRGGSRIAVSSRACDSDTAPCRSSRPSMSPVLALLSSPWWRSLCFVCHSLSEASKLSDLG